MKCRRCMVSLNGPKDPNNENIHDLPDLYMSKIGYEYPTAVCIDCYDDWYMKFAPQLMKISELAVKVDILKDSKNCIVDCIDKALSGGVVGMLNDACRTLSETEIGLNTATIAWMRKGKDSDSVLSNV